jgi:hypothetical protein
VDEFILSMNRAAEAAAPSAQRVFMDANLSMSFDDARKILSGEDTAATDYFKSKTTDQLTVAFGPVVEKTMDQNGVTQQYKQLMGQAQTIPFTKGQNLDITNYVVSAAPERAVLHGGGRKSARFGKTPRHRSPVYRKRRSANRNCRKLVERGQESGFSPRHGKFTRFTAKG